jgi:parallel beta-helix repeat protein
MAAQSRVFQGRQKPVSICMAFTLAFCPAFVVAVGQLSTSPANAQQPASSSPAIARPPMVITKSIELDPAKTYGSLVVKASNITIDGRGAWLVGAQGGKPNQYHGVAVLANGVSGVTFRNLNAKGWETGLKLEDVKGCKVEHCNFSDNFHDPEFGWGENGQRGGIVLLGAEKCTLRHNSANRVWDACVLVDCSGNTVEDNDFSFTSDTCLKLWHSCRNEFHRNKLSHGIRINPGEVHARDSTCVLIESGSNDNRFIENDCTYGGDGIFIRVLNGWVSTGNVFEKNDCSYANNNCVEAWSPRNIYRSNKANHGSYGFWLGASDQTLLEGNEASYNGDPAGYHNSPHLPEAGHAGIVFIFGPSSHTIARKNRCIGNNGAGIALVGDIDSQGKKWKAQHWIIEQNTLKNNRWGIYVRYADWIDMAANVFADNREGNLRNDGNVTNLTEHRQIPQINRPPKATLDGPLSASVGQSVVFDASRSIDPQRRALGYRWDLGDGRVSKEPRIEHRFRTPGFYRVGLTVNNGLLSDLAWRDFYAVEQITEMGTEGQAAAWSWIDPDSRVTFSDDQTTKIAGNSSTFALVKPYSGNRVSLLYPFSKKAGIRLDGKRHLVFWIKAINENVPAWQDVNPLITLYESAEKSLVLRPAADLMSQRPNNEEREGWSYFAVPLSGDKSWLRDGKPIEVLNYLTIGFDSWGAPPLRIWIDGMAIK